jgi:hypothetical protein
LKQHLNLDHEDDWIMVASWLVGAANPNGPYPILVVHGEQGGAKSTLCKAVRSLIDPSYSPLRDITGSNRDLLVSAMNNWVLAFDNVGGRLSDRVSDDLCKIATGSGFGARKLYSDGAEFVMQAARPVIINGLGDFVAAPDLADRCVQIEVPTITGKQRKTELHYWDALDADRPAIFAGLLTAISAALRGRLRGVLPPSLPRMADYTAWIYWAQKALPWPWKDFESAYDDNTMRTKEAALLDSPLVGPLTRLVSRGTFEGPAGTLLSKLNSANIADAATRRHPQWPPDAAWLARKLRRLAPPMRSLYGITITFKRAKTRIIRVEVTHGKKLRRAGQGAGGTAGPSGLARRRQLLRMGGNVGGAGVGGEADQAGEDVGDVGSR